MAVCVDRSRDCPGWPYAETVGKIVSGRDAFTGPDFSTLLAYEHAKRGRPFRDVLQDFGWYVIHSMTDSVAQPETSSGPFSNVSERFVA